MNETQRKWNDRWREKNSTIKWQVDVWLQKVLPLLPAGGRALDVACGVGRNALFLAEQRFRVTAVDISDEALGQLRREAESRGLSIECCRVDLESDPVLPAGPFDLVLVLFYLHRPLLPLLSKIVRPGGVVVLRTFSSPVHLPAARTTRTSSCNPVNSWRCLLDGKFFFMRRGVSPHGRVVPWPESSLADPIDAYLRCLFRGQALSR